MPFIIVFYGYIVIYKLRSLSWLGLFWFLTLEDGLELKSELGIGLEERIDFYGAMAFWDQGSDVAQSTRMGVIEQRVLVTFQR